MINPFETLRDMGKDAPCLYVSTTGAGAGFQGQLWNVPGISNFFVGSAMTYEPEDTNNFLGFIPDKYVTVETAIDLAQTAYLRAWRPGRKAIGLGMTCSVASTSEHRGDHRVIVAGITDEKCVYLSLVIPKGSGAEQRVIDGELSDQIAAQLLSYIVSGDRDDSVVFCKGSRYVEYPLSNPVDGDAIARARVLAHPLFWADGSRGTLADIAPAEIAFFPGAFNPPHPGHFGGAREAIKTLATDERQFRRLVFSTTVNPPHKPALSTVEMLQRAKCMKGHDFLLTEDDPFFIHKARKFPGAYFVMGADAMDRMLDETWGEPVRPMLNEFDTLGTRFLVPGRLIGDSYMTCGNVFGRHIPVTLGRSLLFVPVNFRLDLSSSELRAKGAA